MTDFFLFAGASSWKVSVLNILFMKLNVLLLSSSLSPLHNVEIKLNVLAEKLQLQ
jgi:hypothetical protein